MLTAQVNRVAGMLARGSLRCGERRLQLLIVRHGIAEELDAADRRADAARRLTARGRRRMRTAAKGLHRLVEQIDVLASSPLVRAQQTARIISKAYGGLHICDVDALANQPVKEVLRWVQQQSADATVALVGHKPQLGMLVSWLLCGEQRSFVEFRKGGACLLWFKGAVKAGKATLIGMWKPSTLRALSR